MEINGPNITVADYNNTSNNYYQVQASLASPTAIVGMHPSVPTDETNLVGRTFIGYRKNTLLIYCRPAAVQAEVRSILDTEFDIPDNFIIMMDGSASSQMVCRGIMYLTSPQNRPIPSAIEVLQP